MKEVNEQFAEWQKKTLESIEPMQKVAAEAFERIARKNYEMMGDMVEYAVTQVKTPINSQNPQETYEQCLAETKAFAEKVNTRASEYVELASELGELAKSKSAAPAASAPAKAKKEKKAEAEAA